ncbi:hypothetical protein A9Q99_02015 [Gammaproteobacteria bacterium 45_16_T64]|nr:hypothetical protein A9Q99_02015 [Gammaproteobacteria bacterium 45_16_T64]
MNILRFIRNRPKHSGMLSPSHIAVTSILLCGSIFTAPQAVAEELQVEITDKPTQSVRLDKPHPVKDLAYGEFLFDYYQEKYFTSISKAMIADKRGLLKHHEAQTQVLLGSLYVGYGMLGEAEGIFNNLLENATAKTIRDKVWYHLAEVYYKRSNYDKTIEILQSQIDQPPQKLANDIELLLAQSLIAKGDLEKALKHLDNIKRQKGFSQFAKFNLASAHAILDQPDKAKALYLEVLRSRTKRKDKVATALKDRAALALGSNHLKSEDWSKARVSFESIKLNGASSNTALLGLGWSYLNADDPVGALAPWQELSRRNSSDPAVQEVLLNLPLVYEKAGALQDALDGYRAANEHYGKEFEKLVAIQQSIDDTDWIDSLTPPISFSLDPLDNVETFTLPENELSEYLYQFYASHDFQESFRDYRELQRLKQLLNQWQREVPIFNEMVDANIERLNILQPKAKDGIQKGQTLLSEGTEKLVEFTQRLNNAIAENDITITATDAQALLLNRLETLGSNLEKLPNIPDYDAERERYRVIKGVLLWDLNESAVERRWERTKDKVFIEGQLALLEERIQLVITARERKLDNFDGYRVRITDLDRRLTDLQTKSLRGILHQRAYLKAIARSIITQHQQHIRNLQANAIFSIARLQDMAYIQSQEPTTQPDQIPEDLPQSTEGGLPDQSTNQSDEESSSALPNEKDKVKVPLDVEKRKSLFDGSFKSIFGFGD